MPVDVNGGAPLLMDLPITLCSRSDVNNSRYFDGAPLFIAFGCGLHAPSAQRNPTPAMSTNQISAAFCPAPTHVYQASSYQSK